MPKLSMREFAELVGVHYATVSRTFNNQPGVSQETREHIFEEAKRLGFTPNLKARGLKLKKSFTVGMITPSILSSYWGTTTFFIQKHLEEKGYHLVISPCWEQEHGTLHALEFLLNRDVDALILSANNQYSHCDHQEIMRLTRENKKPTLLFVTKWDDFYYSFLGHATKADMKKACEYLIKLGHSEIAIMASSEFNPGSADRLSGSKAPFQSDNLCEKELAILCGGYGYEDGKIAAKEFLQLNPRPTAIIASNDLAAGGLYNVFYHEGIKIPDNVSIIGYGGMSESQFLFPELTTIVHDYEAEGERAAEIIIDMINGNYTNGIYEEIPGQLLIRDSCKAVSSSREK